MIEDSVFQEPDYTQENNFNSGVANLFTNFSSGTGTVTSISQGTGISCNPNPITSSGTIYLNASINDLYDVGLSVPQTNQVLTYNGTSWINQAMNGSSPIAFTSLTDTPNTLSGKNGDLLAVNSTGTSIITITNDYKNSINSGSGIQVIDSTNSARVLLDAGSLLQNYTSNSNDKYVIEDSNGNNRRIKQTHINVGDFNNNIGYVNLSNLTAESPVTYTTYGTSLGVFGLCLSAFDETNFNNGVSGVLSIVNGGTSGSTSASARVNLGLVYNVDILAQSGPSFDNTMYGDNILLQPSEFGLSVGTSGTDYTPGDAYLFLSGYDTIGICITATGPDGGISSFIVNDGGTSYFARGDYPDTIETWSVIQGAASGGSFSVTPEINYINFGNNTGYDGIGIRNNLGTIELKQSSSYDWRQIYPITTSDIDDIITTGVSTADILVYNGTSWYARGVDGAITINSTGTTSLTGGINPGLISTTGTSVTIAEFSTLNGMSPGKGTIQAQLDGKIGTDDVSPVLGDLIYYSDSAPTAWQPLSIGASRQILNTGDGTSIPSYNYLHDILVSSVTTGISSSANINIAVMSNTGPDLYVPMYSILDQFTTGTSNGINVSSDNTTLELNIYDLVSSGVSLTGSDQLAYYQEAAGQTKKVTLTQFCDDIAGSGLCANSGVISVNFTGDVIQLPVYTYGTSPTDGISGSLVYFSDGSAGNPCLGVHNGVCWHRIDLGLPISPS